MKLTARARSKIPTREFAEPGARKYPIEDKSHARNAISRASQQRGKSLTPAQATDIIKKARARLK